MPNYEFKTYHIKEKVLIIRKYSKPNQPGMYLSLDIGLKIKNLIPVPINMCFSDGSNKYQKQIMPNSEETINQTIDLHKTMFKVMLPNTSWS